MYKSSEAFCVTWMKCAETQPGDRGQKINFKNVIQCKKPLVMGK